MAAGILISVSWTNLLRFVRLRDKTSDSKFIRVIGIPRYARDFGNKGSFDYAPIGFFHQNDFQRFAQDNSSKLFEMAYDFRLVLKTISKTWALISR